MDRPVSVFYMSCLIQPGLHDGGPIPSFNRARTSARRRSHTDRMVGHAANINHWKTMMETDYR